MAFLKGSRYADVQRFSGASGFKGVRARPIPEATPVLEHEVSLKDRLDQLATEYYSAPRAWVRLSEANLEEIFPEDLLWEQDPTDELGRERLGHVILVPRREEER